MKTKTAILFLICVIFLAACGGVTPYAISPVSPTFVLPNTTPFPTTTHTLTITPNPWNTPTPETFNGYPTQVTPIIATDFPVSMQREDFSVHDLYFGKYVVRKWCGEQKRENSYFNSCVITISSLGEKQIEILGYPAYLREETGVNLTGNGNPDIVIVNAEGNCCVETIVYEAGDTLDKVMDVWSQDPGTFADLNNDGTFEYIAPIKIWSQFHVETPVWAKVVYQYQGKAGYIPATYKFKNVLSADIPMSSVHISKILDFLTQFTKQNPNMALHFLSTDYFKNPSVEDKEYLKFDKENPDYSRATHVLYELVVYYLLAGQQIDAQGILNKHFPPDKASMYMVEIQKELQGLLAP